MPSLFLKSVPSTISILFVQWSDNWLCIWRVFCGLFLMAQRGVHFHEGAESLRQSQIPPQDGSYISICCLVVNIQGYVVEIQLLLPCSPTPVFFRRIFGTINVSGALRCDWLRDSEAPRASAALFQPLLTLSILEP